MQVNLAAYNNNWYKPGPIFKRAIWYIINVVFFKSSLFPFSSIKVFLLKIFGAKIGKGTILKPCINIKYPWFLVLGNNVWIGENVWIDNLALITIGSNVCISQSAFLMSGNHDYTKPTFDLILKPIIINDGVWIGAKAIITGGAICANHTVIAAGTVFTGNSLPYEIYKGNPAIKIKERIIV